jgi:glycosyltransferase involved in cell wall biosynthesis
MRMIIGTDTFAPDVNGASYFTQHLASGLAARGHEVHVLCPSTDRSSGTFPRADGVVEHRVAAVRTPFHPTFRVVRPAVAVRDARRLVASLAPDVVHVQGHFPIGRALLRCARRSGIPVVATNHFMPENLLGYVPGLPAAAARRVKAWAWRDFARVFDGADVVTTPTPIAAALLEPLGLRPPVLAVSCGVDLDRFRPRSRPTARWRGLPDKPTVLFVGRLDAEKRIGDLVDALALVRSDVDAQLVLVGTGGQRDALAARAAAAGVAGNVHFCGFVPDDELAEAYAACDVFANAGVAELQSLVTMEAMAAGRPVVAADAVALPHLVRHGENGFRFAPGDVAAAAGYLRLLLTDRTVRTRMGTASRVQIAQHSLDASLARFEQIYADAAERPVRAPLAAAAA